MIEVLESITQDEAEDILYDKDRLVAMQFEEKHRWYSQFLVVFTDGDDFKSFFYDKPATEMQEDQDIFTDLDQDDNVVVYRAYPIQSTTYVIRK